MTWLALLLAIGPGDVYREFPAGAPIKVEQLAGALRAEDAAGEVPLSTLRTGKFTQPVRVFYGASVPGPGGRITFPKNGGTIKDNPSIEVDAEGEVEIWAFYEGAWQKISAEWDTTWLPDQPKKGLRFQARLRRADGLWTATRYVDGVTLERKKLSVKRFQAGIPSAELLAGATEAAWLEGETITPVPLAELKPRPGATLLVRYQR